jgi:hypothetical protein
MYTAVGANGPSDTQLFCRTPTWWISWLHRLFFLVMTLEVPAMREIGVLTNSQSSSEGTVDYCAFPFG